MIQAVDRALRILTVLQGGRRMSLGEIATAIDLAPSTVHGLVRTLLAHGMVQQEIDSGRYRLGPATLRLGNVYLDTLELRSRVAIWAEDLARRTGCAAPSTPTPANSPPMTAAWTPVAPTPSLP